MIIKELRDEDFTNYRLPSMVVGFPHCTFKCEQESGCTGMCQNCELATSPEIELTPNDIVMRYMNNPITRALVCGGLEPFDDWEDVVRLLAEFRYYTEDPFVIYTGYYKEEIPDIVMAKLKRAGKVNLIIKWGRYVPNQQSRFDDILGIELASDNQYAEKIL